MPYVRRGDDGEVAGIYAQQQPVAAEFLDSDDPEITAFLNPPPGTTDYAKAISDHIEATARHRGYDSQDRLSSYLLSEVPAWKAEAQAFISWRDKVWSYVFESQAAIVSGQRQAPRIDDMVQDLPVITWPSP